MYRFLVFGYWDYYPAGGMNDCVKKTNDQLEVLSIWESDNDYDCIEVYDCRTNIEYDDINKFKRDNLL